jgi:predicted lysophospholipase L1 biosynthesis ABC-type transport system permease subunit
VKASFPRFDRSDKPTVAETVAESRFESDAEARAKGVRKTIVRPLMALVALVGLGLGIGTDSWTYTAIVVGVVAVAFAVERLILHRHLQNFRADRRRSKELK